MVAERYFQRSAPTQERGVGGLENGSIHEVTKFFDTDLANQILVHDGHCLRGRCALTRTPTNSRANTRLQLTAASGHPGCRS